jgi:hypothetical protein
MPTPEDTRDTAARWAHWQAALVSQRALTPRAAAQGSTLLKVPPQRRAAFFAVVDLLQARTNLERKGGQGLRETQTAWRAWQTWTRRCAASLARSTTGREGTGPPVPEALRTLRDDQEESDAL